MSKDSLRMSSKLMYEEASGRGAECETFGDGQTVLMKKNGVSWYVRGSRTSLQSSVGKTIADHKVLTKKVLGKFGLPSAKYRVYRGKWSQKWEELSLPVVVKPVDGRHGEGVLVGINDLGELKKVLEASEEKMLVEEMLEGVEYRVVCVDYKFVAAAFRKRAFVVGDGSASVEELIGKKNGHEWRGEGHEARLTRIRVDGDLKSNLAEQELELGSVVEEGREVWLRKTANLSTGGEAVDVTSQVGPENRELFERIARACDLNVVGIDVMCRSIEEPIENQERAGVIEVNASPGLRMHHYPVDGEAINVAGKIMDMLERELGV